MVNKFAYVTLVMKGDNYTPGAIVLAESIRRSGSTYDILCMCTPDVSDQAREHISTVARVVSVDYVRYDSKPMLTKRQAELYASWMSESYTKWRCLEFDEYDKILFVDADMLVTNNIDHLFDLNAPAATFSSPWAKEFHPTSSFDLKNYPTEHADRVPAHIILETIERGWGYLAIASLVLLKPDRTHFREMCQMVELAQPFGLDTLSTPDEESIVYFYANRKVDWTMIHQRYNAIIHKIEWLRKSDNRVYVPSVIHYFSSTKPWQGTNPFKDSPFPTDLVWWGMLQHWRMRTCHELDIVRFDELKHTTKITIRNSKMIQDVFPWIVALKFPFPELF